jgi:hypothetical protein
MDDICHFLLIFPQGFQEFFMAYYIFLLYFPTGFLDEAIPRMIGRKDKQGLGEF